MLENPHMCRDMDIQFAKKKVSTQLELEGLKKLCTTTVW